MASLNPDTADTLLNHPHLPKKTGKHTAELTRMLARIPDGWGRWIDVGPGWYSAIVECDRKLAEIWPNYEIHQIKEKYGELRYYYQAPMGQLDCCVRFFAEHGQLSDHPAGEHQQWVDKIEKHRAGREHKEYERELEKLHQQQADALAQMDKIVEECERQCRETCEETGLDGVLMVKGGWYKTLNPKLAGEGWKVA